MTGLPRHLVADVYDLQKVLRSDLIERVRTLPAAPVAELDRALRLALGL